MTYDVTPLIASVAAGHVIVVETVDPMTVPTLIPWRLIAVATGPVLSTARNALTSRPVAVRPAVAASGVPVARTRARRAVAVGEPLMTLRARAATPAACGAAMDVPPLDPKPPGTVEMMLVPGAAMSTDVAP